MSDPGIVPSPGAKRKASVLLVDDEPTLLRGLVRLLSQRCPHWELTSAVGVSEALSHLGTRSFDLLMTDLQMPGVDGLTLLELARDRYPRMVRVIYSSHTETFDPGDLSRLAHRIVKKPALAEVLEELLEWALTRRSQT